MKHAFINIYCRGCFIDAIKFLQLDPAFQSFDSDEHTVGWIKDSQEDYQQEFTEVADGLHAARIPNSDETTANVPTAEKVADSKAPIDESPSMTSEQEISSQSSSEGHDDAQPGIRMSELGPAAGSVKNQADKPTYTKEIFGASAAAGGVGIALLAWVLIRKFSKSVEFVIDGTFECLEGDVTRRDWGEAEKDLKIDPNSSFSQA